MPSTINKLFKSVGIESFCKVKWGEKIYAKFKGVYIVSLSEDPTKNIGLLQKSPIDNDMIEFWIKKVKAIELDGINPPNPNDLKRRLSEFWMPDENIIYIGKTDATLKKRISQYYRTELGNDSPHSGGQWIKTLVNLNNLHIYFGESTDPKNTEDKLLEIFSYKVSKKTLSLIRDPEIPIPFANLKNHQGKIKNHGINKSTL